MAYVTSIEEAFDRYLELVGDMSSDILIDLEDENDYGRFCDTVASYMMLKHSKKQELLEAIDVKKRLEKLLVFIENEIEVVTLEKKIGTKIKSKIGKVQKNII